MLLLTFAAAPLLAGACGGTSGTEPTAAQPEFCGWAAQIEANLPPTPPPTDPDEPLDVERLVTIGEQLASFAGTLESAAAFAPSDKQVAFTELASFNREVASVITGSASLPERSTDAARDAADIVVETLADECAVRIDVASALAFVRP